MKCTQECCKYLKLIRCGIRSELIFKSGDEGSDGDRSSMSVQGEDDEECDREKAIPTHTLAGEALAGALNCILNAINS